MTVGHLAIRPLATLLIASLVACATVVRRGEDGATLTPPRPRSAVRPALVGATLDRPLVVEVAVEVDEAGLPDVATVRLAGTGADANRGVITDWLRATVFEPARRNGVPVRATFRMTAETTVSVAR